MKGGLWRGMLAAAIAFPALSGVAGAQHDDGCSNATLHGDYAFAVTGWNLSPDQLLWVPEFIVGIAQFDGKGKFTQVDYPADGHRTMGLTDFRTGQTGTYAVRGDCTGLGELDLNVGGVGTGHGVIKLAFVVSHGGRSIHAVVSGSTSPFATQPEISQVRTDFWKVGSEQEQ